jgi:hypothetical protein
VGLAVLGVSLAGFEASAAEPPPLAASGRFRPRLSLVDAPFTFRGGVPSMQQSLEVSHLMMEGGSWGIDLLGERLEQWTPPWLRYFVEVPLLILWDTVGGQLPGGDTWLHEEWHRAVMSRYGVSSFNEVYEVRLFRPFIAVKRVSDEGLAFIKDRHPQDFVRLAAAGMEAQVADTLQLQRDIFFERRNPLRNLPHLWLSRLNVSAYLSACVTTTAAEERELTAGEVDIAQRDFVGLDCSSWVYDLENDRQPYAARGTHPTGVGIDRYRYVDQLSPRGKAFLEQAVVLSLLNFVSPQLLGLGHLPVPGLGEEARWNFALTHQLTSFGQVVDGHLFASVGGWNVGATYHHYLNGARAFPGLELLLVRWPVPVQGVSAHLSSGVQLWLQPAEGRFSDTEARLGGGARAEVAVDVLPRLSVFAELDAKTAGWVSGNVYLDPHVQARLGVEAAL